MKLNVNSKKIASLLVAGGITLSATTLDAKAPTTEDTITTIIVDNLNEMHKRNIVKDDDIDVYYNRDTNYVAYANCSNQILPSQKQMMVYKNIYEDIYNFIGTPNYDKLTLIKEKPIYAIKTNTTYTNVRIDDKTQKVVTEKKDEAFVYGYERYYIDPTCEEYFEEKYGVSFKENYIYQKTKKR